MESRKRIPRTCERETLSSMFTGEDMLLHRAPTPLDSNWLMMYAPRPKPVLHNTELSSFTDPDNSAYLYVVKCAYFWPIREDTENLVKSSMLSSKT